LVVIVEVDAPVVEVVVRPVTWMEKTELGLMKVEVNEKVMVFPPVRVTDWPGNVSGENEGCHAVTVPSTGVPVVPAGTDMVIELRLLPVGVVNPNVYEVPVLAVAAVDDHERLVIAPSALAGLAATRELDAATRSAISTMSVVRPRLTQRRRGRLRGRVAQARTVW
jgi:hypothetical protein